MGPGSLVVSVSPGSGSCPGIEFLFQFFLDKWWYQPLDVPPKLGGLFDD